MSEMTDRDAARKQEKKRVSRKYVTLFLLMLVWGIFIIIKMALVMFGERQYWNDVSKNLAPVNRVIEPRRGNILSDEGLLLASSMKQYRVFLDFKTAEKASERAKKDQLRKDTLYTKHLAEFARQMHDIFPQYSVQEFVNHYEKGYAAKSHSWLLLPNASRNSYPISYNQYKSLAKTIWLKPKYEGWFFSAESKISRQKPFGTLAARTIGSMFEAKDSARNGLELSFDSLLRGVPGRGHMEKVQNVSRMIADIPQIDGCDIYTTINVDMQDIAEVALRKQLEFRNAASGIVVLMEVPTGDIKAIASLTKTESGQFSEIQNNAVKELFEPGSTFKPVSMMVALDDGKISLTDSVYCEHGRYTGFGGGAVMTDAGSGYGWLDVPGIIKNSCNIGTSKLINAAYKDNPQAFVDGIYRTGINTHFDLQLTGTAAPVIRRDGYWDATRLPWMSIGYNTQLPVINTLAFYNGVANGGCMVAPRLVTKVTREGEVVKEFPVEVVRRHMCKDETLEQVRFLLENVVQNGTGKNAQSKYFTVAGKTGTAQLSQGAEGYRNGRRTHMVSFCGYFPADNPQYSCIVSIRTDGGAAGGATWAAPVFHEVSEKVMASRNPRDIMEAYDSTRQFIPKVLPGDLAKASTVLKGMGKKNLLSREDRQVADTVWGTVSSDSGRFVMNRLVYEYGIVPDVHGMGASDALYLLEKMGLRVSINGVGKVKSQSLPKNTRFHKGDRIQLNLSM
ncbi:MAG: PASTA domain-containing protein [Bacteroidaceae bacterium]|jgi:cell division protein FtsI (penicillin-binding protein 3)|nr:PASTA domain-containing protein [Bacteroidaceae bacterium]